jgi:hypothetical protein
MAESLETQRLHSGVTKGSTISAPVVLSNDFVSVWLPP